MIRVIWLILFICCFQHVQSAGTPLADAGLSVIPYPREVKLEGDNFSFGNTLTIVLNKTRSASDLFTANELARDLKTQWNIDAVISTKKSDHSIILTRTKPDAKLGSQGYTLEVSKNEINISAPGEEGLFYGTQTLLQLIQQDQAAHKVIGLRIRDWPDIKERAVHYDTKHHQDKLSYVQGFIKELAMYKINILVWEWEDKFAYPSHPEIGAPGAFTPAEIKGLTEFAKKYHIQIVPLVQGLGHVSFILKWPQHAHLREIAASNFEFCPLKEGTYQLLFDLWKDAIDATPGSNYIHIGSDETYELGLCDQCKEEAKKIGKKGLYHLFSNKAAEFIKSKGRRPMIWEAPLGWLNNNVGPKLVPNKSLVLTEEVSEPVIEKAKKSKDLGYSVFFYDPNPGSEPLFLPYVYRENKEQKEIGCLEASYNVLKKAAASGVFDGVIKTSWDDAGLHNQIWMLSFLAAAEFSWNSNGPGLEEFKETFFRNYYGNAAVDMDELFYLLNEGAYYYWDTFERKVWHFGEIGKTYIPDLPRGDALEYDPYWNKQHKQMVDRSAAELKKIDTALAIIEANKKNNARHLYDFEVFETIAQLVRHTCQTYLDLSQLEDAIKEAHKITFVDRDSAYSALQKAERIVADHLNRRATMFQHLVSTWEKTRLPRGMSENGRKYFFQQDRTRHFGYRTPGMDYLVCDEQQLDLEGYLEKLRAYMVKYKNNSF